MVKSIVRFWRRTLTQLKKRDLKRTFFFLYMDVFFPLSYIVMPTDIHTGIFYENQSGGLCRMHALNAFFGYSKITENDFQRWVVIYDNYLKERFNVGTSSAAFDLMNSDQTNLVSFILKKHKVHARYYALNTLYGKPIDPEVLRAHFVFVYNAGHIWGIKSVKNKHYKVDSMGGVHPFNIQELRTIKDIGILVPVPMKYEWNKKKDEINIIMDKEGIKSKRDLGEYLRRLHATNDVLGCLEIPLGVAMSILETNMPSPPNNEFKRISDLIDRYAKFMSTFTDGNYNKIDLILLYIPDIIFELMSLQ
jgi:hypothetical protein